MRFKKFKKHILDILFPIHCISCQKPDKWICRECLKKITLQQKQVCPICEKIESQNGQTCRKCKKRHTIDNMIICTDYKKSKLVKKAIHLHKYRFAKDIGISLGRIMQKQIYHCSIPIPDIIIPIPLHPKRLRWRGFNQSEVLSDYLSKNIAPGIHIESNKDILYRKKYTYPQANIQNYNQRKKNLEGVFEVSENKSLLKNKSVLLVDDVSTTGTTIFECAKILKKNGVKKVFAIVLARPQAKRTQTQK